MMAAGRPMDTLTLVLADVGMPEAGGHTLLSRLRSWPARARLAARRASASRSRLPDGLPTIIISGRDVATPPRAAAPLPRDRLTRERLAFAIRRVTRDAP